MPIIVPVYDNFIDVGVLFNEGLGSRDPLHINQLQGVALKIDISLDILIMHCHQACFPDSYIESLHARIHGEI